GPGGASELPPHAPSSATTASTVDTRIFEGRRMARWPAYYGRSRRATIPGDDRAACRRCREYEHRARGVPRWRARGALADPDRGRADRRRVCGAAQDLARHERIPVALDQRRDHLVGSSADAVRLAAVLQTPLRRARAGGRRGDQERDADPVREP